METVTVEYLRFHYGNVYAFTSEDGTYTAVAQFGGRDVLEADSPAELLTLVRRHYPGRSAEDTQ
jgi:hypothetical protein